MKIGIAGPMSLDLLKPYLPDNVKLPSGYPFPMTAMLVTGLINRGYQVVAYTTSIGLEQPLVIKGKNLTLCIGIRGPHATRDLFYSERKDLVMLMKENPVDVINAQWSYEFAWAALDSGIPTLVTLHDHALTILKYQFDAYRLMRLLMNRIVLKKAKYLSANSQYLYNLLSKKNKKKTKIIPNFYNNELEKYYVENKVRSNYIVSVANGFGKRKNIINGLKAFKIVRKYKKTIRYHLIGEGMGEGGPAFNFAKKNDLLEGVEFIGAIPFEQVKEEISNALIFLHPSREESFGMVILEAMVMGTPVVGGENSGNVPYLLNKGECGLLCEINKPQSIANAIETLLYDNNLAENIREKAFNFAKNNFSEDKVISSYINYYKKILNNYR